MDWIAWSSITALVIVAIHEFNRFPATSRSLHSLQEALEKVQSDNEDLERRLSDLEQDYSDVSEQLARIRDPVYWQALDDGDGLLLYELDKQRNKT
mgnify:CR=1 FL=1|jgi:predicted nuclease with TOPRIM domain